MKQDAAQMTFKKRLSVTVATMGLALVSTLVGAQANGPKETAAPPSPVLAENTTKNNYPPTGFDPEKKSPDAQKSAGSKQQPKAQHKWPNASQGAVSSKEYPPQTGIDLTPPAKTPVAKPELKYPEFPKVSWPKDAKGNPIYPPFQMEKPAVAAKVEGKAPVVKAPGKQAPGTAKQAAPAASPAPAVQWAPPPQPWGQPVWQPPGQVPGAGDAEQAWQEAQKKAEAEYNAWRAEQEKMIKERQLAVQRQWEAQQAEMKKARTAYEAQQVEQEKMFKARQAALKKQWEAQQVELKRAREAHDAEMNRREDEARHIQSQREKALASQDDAMKKKIAEMDKQAEARRKAMEAQMAKQREAMKAEMAIMNQRAKSAPVPPLPPKASPPADSKREYATPEQIAPKQAVPPARIARPFPGSAPQGNWGNQAYPHWQQQNRMAPQGNWGYQAYPHWQQQNRMAPPWGYNPYWQGANRPWSRAPYPYGPGYYRPR